MTSGPNPLRAEGARVSVATPTEHDLEPYRRAVEQSRARVGVWNPVNPDDLIGLLGRQSEFFRTFLIRANDPVGDHDVVGKVNVFNIVQGRFWSGTMGYDSYDPYAGTGMFAEGFRLVVDLCFRAAPHGLGLHRLEANVQPRNLPSAGLLRSVGFRRERHVKRMLFLEGGGEPQSWREHESFALTADEPRIPYGSNGFPRIVVVVDGPVGTARRVLARDVAAELGIPLFAADTLAGDPQLAWRLLAESPTGGVVEGAPDVDAGLATAGVDPAQVLRVTSGATSDRRQVTRIALEARALAPVT